MTSQAIFLSYASQDADAARRICEALRAAGLEVWFDRSELRGGDAWDASIRKQIKECSQFVPIISDNTNAREEGYFRLEWKLAVDRSHLMADNKAFFFPVILGDVTEPLALVPDKFRERQWTRLQSPITDDAATRAFAERIARIFGTKPTAAVATTSRPVRPEPLVGLAALHHHVETEKRASLLNDPLMTNVGASSPPAVTPSIAVLAFANRSASADDEYFSDGLADELLSVLATIKGLRVSARASSFQFKGKSTSPVEIGRALKVGHLLDGSVRKSGNRARIAVQLVDTASGDQHWAETFDRTLDDIFAVQDEIAQAVANELRVKLLAPAASPDTASLGRTTSSEAHRERMQGKALFQRGGYRDRAAAVAYFERAVELDPNYAGAWADLSFALYWRSASGGASGNPETAHDYLPDFYAARDAVARATAIEPNLPEALLTQSALKRILDWNQSDAIDLVRRAARLAPNDALILGGAAGVLADEGVFDEAAAYARRAIEIDPISSRTYSTLARVEAGRGHFAEAEALYQQALALSNSDAFFPRFLLFLMRIKRGRLDECAAMLEEWSVPLHRALPAAIIEWARGDTRSSNESLDSVKRDAPVLACFQIAQVHAYRQEAEPTLEWLKRCIEARDPGVFNVKTDWLFQFLRDDPRYAALLKRLGFA